MPSHSDSVIFIGPSEKYSNKGTVLKHLFHIPPLRYCERIIASFVPPFTDKYKIIYIDLLGPLLAILFLAALLVYGYSFKTSNVSISPTFAILIYSITAPLYCFILCKLSKSIITLHEVISLIGYSLYGHIFTLVISLLFYHESSNLFFFLCLIIFSGPSSFRLAVVLLKTIPVPAMRLIVCSSVAVIQILFLVFVHFAYMHRTFVYGAKN